MTAEEYKTRFAQILDDVDKIQKGLECHFPQDRHLSDDDINTLFSRISSSTARRIWDYVIGPNNGDAEI